jgi:hypothetical protein
VFPAFLGKRLIVEVYRAGTDPLDKLCQFFRYSSDDSSGCEFQHTNPSWPAFFRLLREALL